MPKRKIVSLKDKVTIRYWSVKFFEGERTGHVSLRTYKGGQNDQGIEISFYPSIGCCLLEMDYVPIHFDELALPEKYHSCYVQVKDDNEALYYADRNNQDIKKCFVIEDKQDIFIEVLKSIPKRKPLTDYGEISEIELIHSLIGHKPKTGVTCFDRTRDGIYHSYEEDRQAYGRDPEEVDLFMLDADAINEAYRLFRESGPQWKLTDDLRQCSGLVAHLLVAGGIKNNLKFLDKIKTGAILGGISLGLAGAAFTGIVMYNTVVTAPLVHLIGFAVVALFNTVVVLVPAVLFGLGVIGFNIVAVATGAVISAVPGVVFGGAIEYYYTNNKLGEDMLLTPWDVYRLAVQSKKFEKNAYTFSYEDKLQLLFEQCARIKKDDNAVDYHDVHSLFLLLHERMSVSKNPQLSSLDKLTRCARLDEKIHECTSSYLKNKSFIERHFFINTSVDVFKKCDKVVVEQSKISSNRYAFCRQASVSRSPSETTALMAQVSDASLTKFNRSNYNG